LDTRSYAVMRSHLFPKRMLTGVRLLKLRHFEGFI